jgi:transcriptional regulator with XRE-family HTH domain
MCVIRQGPREVLTCKHRPVMMPRMRMPIEVTSTIHEAVGRNVKRIREAAGLTQQQLGEAVAPYAKDGAPWSNQVISFIERGARQLDAEDLLILSAALDVPAWTLLAPDGAGDEAVTFPSGKTLDLESWARWTIGAYLPANARIAGDLENIAVRADSIAGHLEALRDALREGALSVKGDPLLRPDDSAELPEYVPGEPIPVITSEHEEVKS